MSHVVVYVFLLDNLTGFNNVLNETVIRNDPYSYSNFTPTLIKCNPQIRNEIIRAIYNEINYKSVPTIKSINDHLIASNNDIENEKSREAIYNAVLESGDESDFIDTLAESFDKELEQGYERTHSVEDKLDIVNKTEGEKTVTKKIQFPNDAPFLVAVFETISNVTAQTCAGTLISRRWVLTAGHCISILSTLYANNISSINTTAQKSVYTIVAGATDPLSDGSVHNVTTVLYDYEISSNSTRNFTSKIIETGPHLAMLKIDPEFEGAGLPMVDQKVEKGDVMIYGWTLVQDSAGVDTLTLNTMSAVILSKVECQELYNYNDTDVICLFNNELEKTDTQLSSGGPVLMLQNGEVKLLAAVQIDEPVLIAYLVKEHYESINRIINNKD